MFQTTNQKRVESTRIILRAPKHRDVDLQILAHPQASIHSCQREILGCLEDHGAFKRPGNSILFPLAKSILLPFFGAWLGSPELPCAVMESGYWRPAFMVSCGNQRRMLVMWNMYGRYTLRCHQPHVGKSTRFIGGFTRKISQK